MPKHIARLILLIVAGLAVGLSAKAYFTVDSFYRYGHYRADSVPEIASAEPAYRGPGYCADCHTDRHAQWSGNGHKTVKCEVCHGPARTHPFDPADQTRTFKLPRPTAEDTKTLCTLCHLKLTARPEREPPQQPWDPAVGKSVPWNKGVSQVVPEEHAGGMPCLMCHDPHQPKPIRVREELAQAVAEPAPKQP
ncbi:MAG: hypothetical protein Q8M09_10965 [Pseudomonadota bacterium]|nr:hypothetical protein [Pseudomonadota bacterium]MDP2352617.1 hypothetical protein [Pseudomonadota bacterium]